MTDAIDQHDNSASPPIENTVPECVIVPRPSYRMTEAGDMDEIDAAVYLTWRSRKSVSARTLSRWRNKRYGPVYHKLPKGHVWYRKGDLDDWIAMTCPVDPLDAA